MRQGLFLAAAAAMAAAAPSAAAAEVTSQGIEAMRGRDRFADAAKELAAWRAFAAQVAVDPASSPGLKAEVHGRLAIALFYKGAYAEGWMEIEAAERLIAEHELGRERFVPELLAYASLLSTDLKELDRAHLYSKRSLALAREMFGDDSAEAGLAYNSIAYRAYAGGDVEETARGMCAAAERAQRHLPARNSMVSNNLISCAITSYFVDAEEAADRIRRAAAFAYANLPPDHPLQTLALNGSSSILLALGRYAEAEEVLRRELELARRLLGNHPDVYNPLVNLGRTLAMQNKLEEAEAVYREAIDFADKHQAGSNPTWRGASRMLLGQLHERLGRHEEALARYRDALAAFERDAKPGADTGNARIALARLLFGGGERESALRLAEQGRALVRAGLPDGHRVRLDAEIAYAALLARAGRTAEAFAIARPAADALEAKLLGLATSRTELVSLSPVMVSGFSEYAYVALLAGQKEAAVRGAQLASLSELNLVNAELAARRAAQEEGAGALLDALRSKKLEAGRLRGELARAEAGQGGEATAISRGIDATEAEIGRLSDEIERRFPDYRTLGRPRPASLAELQARLRPNQTFVLPLALSDRMVTIAVTSQTIEHGEAEGAGVHVLVDRIRRSVDLFALAPEPVIATFDTDAAHQLYRFLMPANLERTIAPGAELLFPASGPLASLSPALLLRSPLKPGSSLSKADWLIRHHAVALVSDFAGNRSPSTETKLAGFLGLGNPVLAAPAKAGFQYAGLFRGGAVDLTSLRSLPSLPGSEAELRRMGDAFPGEASLLLTGGAATEARVKALDFSRYSMVAFATHGLTSGEMGGLSEPALVFTPPATASEWDDGLLTASEIAQLSIPADWVILSACNSGSGSNASAPTYSGLARAFRLAGARSLLLSHWRVRDDAAARLTVATVQATASGASRAQALQSAMIDLLEDPSVPGSGHPALWAPFVLIGD